MKQWKTCKPMYVEVIAKEQLLQMELDTGAVVSILPYEAYKKRFKSIKTYTGEVVCPRGQIEVTVRKDIVSEQLIFVVVDGPGPPLFGRNWLASLPVEWSAIKSMTMLGKEKQLVQRAKRLKALLARFPNTAQQKPGTVAGMRAQLPLKEGAIPVFM